MSRHPGVIDALRDSVRCPLLLPFQRGKAKVVDSMSVESGPPFVDDRLARGLADRLIRSIFLNPTVGPSFRPLCSFE